MIFDNFPQEFFDAYPKDLIEGFPKEILKSDEFKFHYREKLPSEHVLRDGRKIISDIPLLTFEGMIINIESQSYPISQDRKRRFNLYQAELHDKHKKQVITVVFSTLHDKHELVTHKINQYDGFTMLIISLKALNKKQTLYNRFYKRKNNINMSDKEKALLLLAPMMDSVNKKDILDDLVDIIFKIDNFGENEQDDMKKILSLYLKQWYYEDSDKDGGESMVTLPKDAQKLIDSWIEEGIEKGIEKDRVEIVSNILSQGLSFEEVSRLTGLSVEEISAIANGK